MPAHAVGEKRVALVIGNAAYKSGPLANPLNDARAMSIRLRVLGFDVTLRENLKTHDIGGTYREFRNKITPGSVALVFYAGHGLQVKGQNFFPAVDADISSEEDAPLQSLNLGTLLDNMEEAKAGVSLVFLDACRDNPFARRFRSSARGLAKVEAASGTLIHYATKPGSVAADGDGRNGTYTEALLAQMSEPGVPVELMLKKVTNQVVTKTKGKQEPWVEGSLRGEFYFIVEGPKTLQVQQTSVVPKAASPADPEIEAWKAAENANSAEGFNAYLQAYPKGRYAVAAQIKVRALDKPVVVAAVSAQPSVASPTTVVNDRRPEEMRPGSVFKDCADCPEMVIIPAGSFEMGGSSYDDERPAHAVRISKAFALGRTEVTQRQWRVVMGNNPSYFKNCGDDCPIEGVSWDDAKAFVQRLSTKTGKSYRLPSEAEWEYACRAGGIHSYCGSENITSVAWYDGNGDNKTHQVALRQANVWGLHDMVGNVWEWVEDCWHGNYLGAPSDGSVWTSGCDKDPHVLRGGSWASNPPGARATVRKKNDTSYRDITVGFRVVRGLK